MLTSYVEEKDSKSAPLYTLIAFASLTIVIAAMLLYARYLREKKHI
jgi:hypothetical protein